MYKMLPGGEINSETNPYEKKGRKYVRMNIFDGFLYLLAEDTLHD
jgi:hypothetical protein